MERVSIALMPEAIRVTTRQRQREFSMFLNLDEAFGVIGQLADIALRRLLDSKGLELDRVLQQPARITKRSVLVQVCANSTNRQFLNVRLSNIRNKTKLSTERSTNLCSLHSNPPKKLAKNSF